MDGFQAGQIDMGYLGAAPALVKSIAQSINITVLAAANKEGSAINVLKSEYDAGHVTSIADLAGKENIEKGHLLEALSFKNLHRNYELWIWQQPVAKVKNYKKKFDIW